MASLTRNSVPSAPRSEQLHFGPVQEDYVGNRPPVLVTNEGRHLEKEMPNGGFIIHCPLCESGDISTLFSNLNVWKCAQCQMMFRNPQPTSEELMRIYEDAFRPENVITHETKMEGTTHLLARQYAGHIEGRIGIRGKRILEFGAGLGIMCQVLRDCGADVTAVEPFAWKECRKTGVRTYRSLDELPNGLRFDLIIALEVIEHLRSPWLTLRKLRRRLETHGWFYGATPNAASIRAQLLGAKWREFAKSGHLLFYTPVTLELALKKAGFVRSIRVNDRVRYCNHFLKRLTHYALQETGLEGELRYLSQTDGSHD